MKPADRNASLQDSKRQGGGKKQGSKTALVVALAALVLACSGFSALGIWQLYRLQWKLALIERVETRIHATPVSPPAKSAWPTISKQDDEYRHVLLAGRYLGNHDSLVKAVTELGPGYWLLTPFQTTDGSIVLVNRGYVPENWQGDETPADTEVIGLLRLSESGGGFLRENDATNKRWYSRDVQAIATAQGLNNVAPYFVDADAAPGSPAIKTHEGVNLTPGTISWPRGGLTIVSFPNNHLGYAFTWFVLALMCAGAAFWLLRDWRLRKVDNANIHTREAEPD
ncbi:MAG: SURF1 family protein [Pedobacter sp.]|nr:SURF1 family protein [Pedobacter sp.]